MQAELQTIEVAVFPRPDHQLWIASGREIDICSFGSSQADAVERLRRELDKEEQHARDNGESGGLRKLPRVPTGAIPEEHKMVRLQRLKSGRWSDK